MIKIAILGCGRIGRMHAANIMAHPRADLTMVYDLYTAAAAKLASCYNVAVANSAAAVFAAEQVDAVLIATSTQSHADYIEQSVLAGKPVLCEKPIDLHLSRVEQCLARISGSDVLVQLGFNRRFDAGHQAARDAVCAGDIGDLHQVIITSRDPTLPPRDYYANSGGIFRDMTIHDFDLARFMLQDEPIKVFATGSRLVAPALMQECDDYDSVMVVMSTADGKQCHINNSRKAVYGYDQRIELFGSKGMVQSSNRCSHGLQRFTASGTGLAEPYQYFFIERYRDAFKAEIESFVAAIEAGMPPEVGFEDGRQALILAETAYLSLHSGRMVKVSEVI